MDVAYWRSAARSLARNLRHTPGFGRDLLTYGARIDSAGKAPTRHLFELMGVNGPGVEMGTVSYRRSNLDPYEQYALGALARLRKPRTIFEIGTYDGATTLLLAHNAPEAKIFTLDLPPAQGELASEPDEAEHARNAEVGARFKGLPESSRITQLFGDSRTFDFSPWRQSIDLVLVDAGHEYEAAKADTESALQLVAPSGLVVWDDYMPIWPGVIRAVDEARLPTFRLASTDFAIYEAPSTVTAS